MESILLLEDDEDFRTLLADTLSDEGYAVTEASDAQIAIDFAGQRSFHLMISDVRMPGALDGVGAIEQIKKQRPHLRSIILTGFTDRDVPVRAAQVQADDYLFKPVEPFQLLTVVRATLDRQSDESGILARLLQVPGSLAQKALSRIFESKLPELIQIREGFLQRFFVLLRSGRLGAEEAYPAYTQLLESESQYSQAKPSEWGKLPSAYAALDAQLLSIIAQPPPFQAGDHPLLSRKQFQRFCQVLRAGEVTGTQFQQSGLLLLDSDLRRANLENYLTYHKLWSNFEAVAVPAGDPLLGKTFGHYTIRERLPESSEVPVYSALSDSGERRLILAFTPPLQVQELIQAEIQHDRAASLGVHCGFELVLLRQKDHTLGQYLPPEGLEPGEAWKLLRPIFLQVEKYHQQGCCSGHLRLEDIRVLPGQPAALTAFNSTYADRQLQEAKKPAGQARMMRTDLPAEILFGLIDEVIPACDQAVLSHLFFNTMRGQRRLSGLQFYVSTNPEATQLNNIWQELDPHPSLRDVLFKMASYDHQERYPSLKEAIADLDKVLAVAEA